MSEETSSNPPVGETAIRHRGYERAERRLLDRLFAARYRAHPILSKIAISASQHVGPIRSVGGADHYDSPPRSHKAGAPIATSALETLDFDAYARAIEATVGQAIDSLTEMMQSETAAMSAHIGHAWDATGMSIKDALKHMLMHVELDFDDDGRLNLSSMMIVGAPPEAKDAFNEVLRDPEVLAYINARSTAFLKARPRRRLLSPC